MNAKRLPAPESAQPALTATPAAREAIAALRAAKGGPLMFFQSAGCCDGSEPMCYQLGEFTVGDGYLLLGTVDDCPFYMDRSHYEAFRRPRLVLDVAAGEPGGFSFAAGDNLRFVTRDAS
jgi:uncharacterized protein (DUF779 family)